MYNLSVYVTGSHDRTHGLIFLSGSVPPLSFAQHHGALQQHSDASNSRWPGNPEHRLRSTARFHPHVHGAYVTPYTPIYEQFKVLSYTCRTPDNLYAGWNRFKDDAAPRNRTQTRLHSFASLFFTGTTDASVFCLMVVDNVAFSTFVENCLIIVLWMHGRSDLPF